MRSPVRTLAHFVRAGLLVLGIVTAAHAAAPTLAVTTYHVDAARSGNFVVPDLTWARARALRLDPAFAPRISGHVYAQPLYWRPPGSAYGMVFVVTESDTVYAIDAATGNTLWRRSVGTPVPLDALPCGNIDPLGITGTPVIDPATQAIYFDAVNGDGGRMRHLIYALSLRNGTPLPGWPVDVAAALAAKGEHFIARVQNQRGALAILNGRVYAAYGGHLGDCGDYHGWVVGVDLRNPHDVVGWRTRARGGGIWGQGGVVSDGRSLFVATGNTFGAWFKTWLGGRLGTLFGARQWSDGDAVIRLAPDLHPDLGHGDRPQDFFTPADWRMLDARDLDLGGSNPLLLNLSSGDRQQALVLALGKDRRAYLLDRNDLGGIGGSLAAETVATEQIITAPAAYPVAGGAFVALQAPGLRCPDDDLIVLKIIAGRPPAIAPAWCGAMSGRGSPIVTTTDGSAQPIVWILGAEGDRRLHGYRGDTGAPLYESPPLSGLRHFQTLIAVPGRLYVAADDRLYAFDY